MTKSARILWSVVAAAVICLCCRRTGAETPTISVFGGGMASGYDFTFEICGRPQTRIPIDGIEVISYTKSQDDHVVVCMVETPDAYGVVTKGWRYGAVPNGFRLTRKCQPLIPGPTYEILVFGAGVGGRKFSIGDDGGLKWLEPTCK